MKSMVSRATGTPKSIGHSCLGSRGPGYIHVPGIEPVAEVLTYRGDLRLPPVALLFWVRLILGWAHFSGLNLKLLSEVSGSKIQNRRQEGLTASSPGKPNPSGIEPPVALRNMRHFHGAPVLTRHGGHCVREFHVPLLPCSLTIELARLHIAENVHVPANHYGRWMPNRRTGSRER